MGIENKKVFNIFFHIWGISLLVVDYIYLNRENKYKAYKAIQSNHIFKKRHVNFNFPGRHKKFN